MLKKRIDVFESEKKLRENQAKYLISRVNLLESQKSPLQDRVNQINLKTEPVRGINFRS